MATDLVQLDTRAQAIYRCGTGVPLRTMMATVHPEDLRALQDLIAAAHRAIRRTHGLRRSAGCSIRTGKFGGWWCAPRCFSKGGR